MKEIRVKKEILVDFCMNVFIKNQLTKDDALSCAKVLVSSDSRGIPSHGVARLGRYINGLKDGLMKPDAEIDILKETPVSIVVNANGAMGAPVSVSTMEKVIEKAKKTGVAFGSVKDSNHFGIAAYYARMALSNDMIGIAMTNTAALGVPTFSRQVMFGTNPFAFAAPALVEKEFVLDMSTTVITRGKIEVYKRKGKELPDGWAFDKNGNPAKDAGILLDDMFNRLGGGILPLGGAGEDFGGHKGYGLAVMVDILCALLSGSSSGPDISDTETSSSRVSHFFGAIKIENFRDPILFRKDMDIMLSRLRVTPPVSWEKQVYYAGLKEYLMEAETDKTGIKLAENVYKDLCVIGEECGVIPPDAI
jgi:LDH2 family malate/lactate/ureidoglycolate dehydrogenase